MDPAVRSVTWEAREHHHDVKGADWLWALGIIVVASAAAAILLGNLLFGIVILLGGMVMAIMAVQPAKIIPYSVTQRGIRVEDRLYPYSTLDCFFIDEDHPLGAQLLIKSEKMLMPLIVMPIPEEYLDEIEELLSARLPEEHLEEPFFSKLLEFFGF